MLTKLPCTIFQCNDPECRRAHLCHACGEDLADGCACGMDCTSDEESINYWLQRSELTR